MLGLAHEHDRVRRYHRQRPVLARDDLEVGAQEDAIGRRPVDRDDVDPRLTRRERLVALVPHEETAPIVVLETPPATRVVFRYFGGFERERNVATVRNKGDRTFLDVPDTHPDPHEVASTVPGEIAIELELDAE